MYSYCYCMYDIIVYANAVITCSDVVITCKPIQKLLLLVLMLLLRVQILQ